MNMGISRRESAALYRLLADATSDIILKTDRQGFVVHASPAIGRLGVSLPSMLIGPHIQDLVHPACAAEIAARHEAAIAGRLTEEWSDIRTLAGDRREHWFQIKMRALVDGTGEIYGVLSVMRSIDERRRYEEQLFAAVMTDPLTGLTNRKAFVEMLRHMIERRIEGCLALFALNHLKAINMKHGQAAGDEALVVFADVLRQNLRSQDIISRVGGESLAVLLPASAVDEAEAISRRTVAALGRTWLAGDEAALAITASASVATIAGSVDDTLKRAEMALFLAKTAGGGRVEVDGRPSRRLSRWPRAS